MQCGGVWRFASLIIDGKKCKGYETSTSLNIWKSAQLNNPFGSRTWCSSQGLRHDELARLAAFQGKFLIHSRFSIPFYPSCAFLISIRIPPSPSATSICAAANPEFGVSRPTLGRPSSGRCVGDRPIKLKRTFRSTNIFGAGGVGGRDIYCKRLIRVLSPK